MGESPPTGPQGPHAAKEMPAQDRTCPAYSRRSLSAYCTDENLNSQRRRPLDQHPSGPVQQGPQERQGIPMTGRHPPSSLEPVSLAPGGRWQGRVRCPRHPGLGAPCLSPSCGKRAAADTPTFGGLTVSPLWAVVGSASCRSGLFFRSQICPLGEAILSEKHEARPNPGTHPGLALGGSPTRAGLWLDVDLSYKAA